MMRKTMPANRGGEWQEPAREAAVILGQAEQRSERILAWLRLGVLIVLVLLQRVFALVSDQHVFAISFAIYGAATLGALTLAYRSKHRPWLGWALTTLLVLHFAATLVFVEGWATSDAITAPGVLMVFAPFGALRGQTHNVAVLFVDIREFTAMAEDLEPAAVLELLNEYRRRVTAPVLRNGGVVDKFIGDAVMAVFSVPRPHASDAGSALKCGVEMLESIAAWNEERVAGGKPPAFVGVGAHYGEAVVGVVGVGERLEYTVIGDTVNLAQRAERIAARSESPMLVTSALLDMAKATGSVIAKAAWIELAPQSVEGRRQAVRFFALQLPVQTRRIKE
jgi:class 3 adenylate cyclase